ncbi:MAG TPA: sulfotransferase [Alphaproteobacteria bacterium]|nr:sulfotransferase [Alphaproteobacteria bacterium]
MTKEIRVASKEKREARSSDPAALFAQALSAHQAGRLDEAEALYRRTLRLDPGHAEAHNWLGVARQQQGDGGAALEYLRKAVALAPGSADFANNLGITELKLGELEAAARSFEKAIALNPRLAQAHYNLGLVCQKRRQRARAIACFRQAIALVPNYANAYLSLGNALSDAGLHDDAVAVLRRLAAMAPNVPAVLFNLATALKAARKFDEAADVARQILAKDPNSSFGHNIMALFLWTIRQHEAAEASARRAVAIAPNDADAHCTLGKVLTTLGRFDDAVASFEAALAAQPDFPAAIYQLVLATKTHSTPEFAARIESALKADWPPDEKIMLHFALGKISDDLGNYARAFENYRAGNELAGAKAPFDAGAWMANVDRAISALSADFFASRKSFGNESRRPVFIVGMPRSGTTLVEQIIASHPDAAAGDELEAMPDIATNLPRRLKSKMPYPACIAEIDAATARELAAEYLAALDRVDKHAARVTDKLPLNFLNLGLIALLFPHATVIHCRRDPMDTCLSCYFARFEHQLNFSFGLESLGAYYRGYRRLMGFWRKVLPVRMLDVDYEDLIADQEGTSRRIIAHCGLEWDDRCLAFHKTERPVMTASAWQVRQPLYKTAVERWRNYESFLAPLRAALEGMEGDGS